MPFGSLEGETANLSGELANLFGKAQEFLFLVTKLSLTLIIELEYMKVAMLN